MKLVFLNVKEVCKFALLTCLCLTTFGASASDLSSSESREILVKGEPIGSGGMGELVTIIFRYRGGLFLCFVPRYRDPFCVKK